MHTGCGKRTTTPSENFILKHISANDYQHVYRLNKCHEVFEELRKRHELLGIYAQAALLKKALDIRLSYPSAESTLKVELIFERVVKVGTLTPDRLFALFMFDALGDNFPHP